MVKPLILYYGNADYFNDNLTQSNISELITELESTRATFEYIEPMNGSSIHRIKPYLYDPTTTDDSYLISIYQFDMYINDYTNNHSATIELAIYEIDKAFINNTDFSDHLIPSNIVGKYITSNSSLIVSTPYDNLMAVRLEVNPLFNNGQVWTFNPSQNRSTFFLIATYSIATTLPILTQILSPVNIVSNNLAIDIAISSYHSSSSKAYRIDNTTDNFLLAEGGGTSPFVVPMGFRGDLYQGVLCFHENSLVKTKNKIKYAKDVNLTDLLLSEKNEYIEIVNIIKTSGCKELIYIPKNSLNENTPNSDLYITKTHMINFNNEYMQAQKLLKKHKDIKLIFSDNKCNVYSFITYTGDYVYVNGLLVKTFNTHDNLLLL